MTYFKAGNTDISQYVSSLSITTRQNYKSEMNAFGDTQVDCLSSKRVIEVGIIPLSDSSMHSLISVIPFNTTIYFLDPDTQQLASANVILPERGIEYYTIRDNNVWFKAATLSFQEL